jgi:DNA polymerase I
MSDKKTVLLIDGLNEFMRGWCANPLQSATTGDVIGGVVGFLKTLSFLTYKIRPSKIVIAWEGKDSSKKRKKILPEYKFGRSPAKPNRFYEESPDDALENKKLQLSMLFKYLNNIPVYSVFVDGLEGDDIIGYLSSEYFSGHKKIILSNDKDFFQLLDGETIIYRSIKREYIANKYVVSKFGILPENFAVARSIDGDVSDNISGVKGFGFKTIIKYFPMLGEKETTIDDLVDHAESFENKGALLERFLENIDVVRTNYRVITLDNSLVSLNQIKKIEYALNKSLRYDKMELLKEFAKDGITSLHYNWSNVFAYLMQNQTGG